MGLEFTPVGLTGFEIWARTLTVLNRCRTLSFVSDVRENRYSSLTEKIKSTHKTNKFKKQPSSST
jgi:hypothetical protein